MKQINHYFKSVSPILHGVTRSLVLLFLLFSAVNISTAQSNHSQCGTDIPTEYENYRPHDYPSSRTPTCK